MEDGTSIYGRGYIHAVLFVEMGVISITNIRMSNDNSTEGEWHSMQTDRG